MNIACHHRHVCTVQKHTPFSVCNRTRSPIWLKCRCFQLHGILCLCVHVSTRAKCWKRRVHAAHLLSGGVCVP